MLYGGRGGERGAEEVKKMLTYGKENLGVLYQQRPGDRKGKRRKLRFASACAFHCSISREGNCWTRALQKHFHTRWYKHRMFKPFSKYKTYEMKTLEYFWCLCKLKFYWFNSWYFYCFYFRWTINTINNFSVPSSH